MRLLISWCLLSAVVGCSPGADEKKTEPDGYVVRKIAAGDDAPPLAVDFWLNGEGAKTIEPGKVYILDFWATWCGPCLRAMPELGELQAEYKDQNVVVIPVTTIDNRNSRKKIEEYVDRVGKGLGLTFAVCEKDKMDRYWFDAAGAEGLPTTFVVDAQRKIAFIGHPMEVPDVLPLVVAGTWKGEESLKAINEMNEALDAIQTKADKNPEAALKDFAAFAEKYPSKAKQTNLVLFKLILLMTTKQFDEAKAISEVMLEAALKNKKTAQLENLAAIWAAPQVNPEKLHTELSLKAIDGLLTLAGENPSGRLLFNAAEVYHLTGNKAKAIEFLDRALAVETNEETKQQMKELGEQFRK